MPDTSSTTSFRADISQLKTAMQQAQRQVRLAESEFKAATAGMDRWSDSAEGLSAKINQLDKVLDAQKKKAAAAREEWERVKKEYGENSAEAENAKIKLNNYDAAVAKTEKELNHYEQELKDCQEETGRFSKETDKAGDEVKQTGKDAEKASDGFTVMKGAMADLVSAGIKVAITGLKNLAAAAKEAYQEFDKGADTIIKKTGATGEAAKELEESYNKVAHNVVGDMGDIGSALGEINTRFGFTGQELEDATEQFLKFADITGTDATQAVQLVSRAMENSGMEAKDYTKLLDILAKAGQTTGVDITSLAGNLQKTGAQMRQLGFTTEESIALFAQFEKTGVNTETALAGMKKAVANWGKEGKNAKEEFAKVLEEIAKAPDVTTATTKAIEAFGTKAGPELAEAIQGGKMEYKDFLKTLQDSTGTVTKTYEATQDGFDKITLAIQGGKADLGQFVREIATEYQDDIVGTIDRIKEGIKKAIKWVVQNAGTIIETIKAVAKVAATLWAVKKAAAMANAITGVITTVKGLVTALKAGETAMSALSGAGGILSSLVSPGGAIVLGLAAVATVVTTIISLTKEEKKQIKVLTEEQEKSVQASRDMKAAYDEMESSRRGSMQAVSNEVGYYQELLHELDSIVGANGKVKEGYEDRAAFITTTLNEALGLEMNLQDGIIENYAKERQAIEQQLEMKKAELILQANEEAYAQAIQKKTEATQTYLKAQETFNEVMAAAEEQAVEVEKVYMEMARIESEDGVAAAYEYQQAHQEVFDTYQALQGEVTNTRAALKDATEAYEGYNQTIQNYEGLSAAIISGDSAKINDALVKTENGFKTANNTTADALKRQRDQYDDNYKRLKKAVEDGDKSVTQQMVDDAKKLAEQSQKEYENSGKNTVAGYAKGLKDSSHYAEEAAKQMGFDSYADFNESLGINSPSTKTYASGEYFAQGFLNGMGSKESAIYNKAKQLAQKAIQGLKDGQKEGSPSKITTQSGVYFTEGFRRGIGSMAGDLVKTVRELAREAIAALGDSSIIADMKQAGKELMTSAAVPIDLGDVQSIRSTIPKRAAAAGSVNNNTSTVNNNYNLVQNNTSPKALTALETFKARQRQIAMVKALL